MAEWVYVENGEILEYHGDVPANWRHISGLNLSKNDLPFLKNLGWFPVTKEYGSYEPSTHYVNGYNYQIREDDVVETLQLSEIPPVIPEPFEDRKNRFMIELRTIRDQKLKDSDWTQLADVQLLFDDLSKEKWSTYRQLLRDIPNIYVNNDITEIGLVEWPGV